MAKNNKPKKELTPIVKITLVNYDPARQDEYSKNFMTPLIEGLLQRIHSAKTE
jgi:hypothetical protein